MKDDATKAVIIYIEKLYTDRPDFTGSVQLNFQNGELKDIQETKRTKVS